ncbi:voltage-gated hydrogen channel 1-like [Ptychodera flava]|uniref:voltage-gated hydrogen channel 1-like n=1 Tax=Ptychodera flava TaxID=63121 RepID=UPI00396A63CB
MSEKPTDDTSSVRIEPQENEQSELNGYHHHYHKMDGTFGFKRLNESKQEDQLRVITKDDTSDSLTSDSQDESTKTEPRNHREKILAFLNHHYVQVAIVILVLIDVVLVLAELLIDIQISTYTPISCNGSSEETDHESDNVGEALHYCSIAILSIFMVEISVRIYCLRLEFFKHKLEVFDAIIVVISFAFDIAYAIDPGTFNSMLGLLIIFRLWRVVRIFNGILLSVKNQAEKKVAAQKRKCAELEQELEKFRQYCSVQEKEIEMLRGELKKHGITLETEEKKERPQSLTQVDVVVEVNKVSDKISDASEAIEAQEQSDLSPEPMSSDSDKSPTGSTTSTIPESPEQDKNTSQC